MKKSIYVKPIKNTIMTKSLMLSILCIFFVAFCHGQDKDHYIKENMFYTVFESGVGEEIPMKFEMPDSTVNKIMDTEIYKNWEEVTFSNPKNEKFIMSQKHMQHVEIFLKSECRMGSFYAKMNLKNSNSYTPIAESKGFIYVNDKNEICISFSYKGQNAYGNFIVSKGYYTLSWVNGEIKR